jgi:hypothetical protein
MWLRSLFALGRSACSPARRFQAAHRRRPRLSLERLEERALPTNYTAATVPELIADIHAANTAGGSNTITLTAPTTAPYVLTYVNNGTDGFNGLPVITKGNLTIVGNGDTIERSNSGVRDFRLMDVASGGSLTLENLTLENGFVYGWGAAADGGALYNQGTLVLSGVSIRGNTASGVVGQHGGNAAGGAIWSNGALTLENGTLVDSNTVHGGFSLRDFHGATAFGGGLYVAAGTLTMTSSTLSNNRASGGLPFATSFGRIPGLGPELGGGLYVAGGTVTLSNDTVTSNSAGFNPIHGGPPSYGGGLYLATGSTVYLNAFTLNNTINNWAVYDPNIHGPYTLI